MHIAQYTIHITQFTAHTKYFTEHRNTLHNYYAHRGIPKMRERFGNTYKGQSWSWPPSFLPLDRFLFFCFVRNNLRVKSFTLAVPLSFGCLRSWVVVPDARRTRRRWLSWLYICYSYSTYNSYLFSTTKVVTWTRRKITSRARCAACYLCAEMCAGL